METMKSFGKKKRYIKYNQDFLQTREWKLVRERVLRIQGKICLRCGSKESINVDHIQSRRDNPELALTISNLQVLCAPCNKDKECLTTDYRPQNLLPETSKSRTVDYILRKQNSIL